MTATSSLIVIAIGTQPVLLLIGIIAVYRVLGMFLEPIRSMLLTLPIILPVIEQSGWSLLWFGVVLTKLLEIGMITCSNQNAPRGVV